jgi:multidrug efflux pump subunit AcrA (membrane-fusion protein)
VKTLILLISLLCIAGLAFAEPATTQSENSDLTSVKRADIRCTLDLDGYFEPIDGFEVRVRPRTYQGELRIVSAAEDGAKVAKGDVLLKLDDEDINQQIALAENELTSAKANATKAQADVKLGEESDALAMQMQKNDLDTATKALDWWNKVDGKHLLEQAELGVKNARANVEDQQDELNELKKMYKSEELTNATADIVVKRALRSLDISRISLSMYEDRKAKTTEFDHSNARQKLVYAIEQQKQAMAALVASQEQGAVARKTAMVSAKLALEKAEQKVKELNDDRDALTVKAPAEGVVLHGQLSQGAWQNASSKAFRAGEKVQPGQVLTTFFVPGKLKLVIDVPEAKVNLISKGLSTRVVPVAFPDATTVGTCESPAPSAQPKDGGQCFATTINLEKVDSRLLPGEKASAHIQARELKDVLTLPVAAVSHGRVRVKGAEGKEDWRDIVTGASNSELVEIKSGLGEGDEVYAKASK